MKRNRKVCQNNVGKGEQTSEQLAAILDKLTIDQIRFVVARQEFATDREAALEIEMRPNTPAQWKHRGVPIDEAVRLIAVDGIVVAREVRRKALAKAMLIKTAGLDDENVRIAQGVATEIIEWEMGKATQRAELTGKDGDPLLDLAEWEHKRQERIDGLLQSRSTLPD